MHMVAAGGMFGLTISAMHYTGMSAYLLPGQLVWETPRLVASVVLGAAIGAATYYLISLKDTRLPSVTCPALMVGAICAMHFTGMTMAKTLYLHIGMPKCASSAARSSQSSVIRTMVGSVISTLDA